MCPGAHCVYRNPSLAVNICNSLTPTAARLNELWADSEVAKVDDMLGHWKGEDFPLSSLAEAMLDKINWHGKWFDSSLDSSRIVVRGDNGKIDAVLGTRKLYYFWLEREKRGSARILRAHSLTDFGARILLAFAGRRLTEHC